MNNRIDVVGIGEAMVVLQPPTGSTLHTAPQFDVLVAGAELNACAAVTSLGGTAAFVTRLGHDPFADRVRSFGEALGVALIAEVDTQHPTGVFFKQISSSDAREVYYYRSGSAAAHLGRDAAVDALALNARTILLSGLTSALGEEASGMMLEVARLCRGVDTHLVLDANLRPALGNLERSVDTIRRLLPDTGVLVLGIDEAIELFETDEPGQIIRAARSGGCTEVVIKDGARGAFWSDGLRAHHVPAAPVRVVDTVGAGDAFTGAYVWARLNGFGPRGSTTVGTRFAARIVGSRGDTSTPLTSGQRVEVLAGIRFETCEVST